MLNWQFLSDQSRLLGTQTIRFGVLYADPTQPIPPPYQRTNLKKIYIPDSDIIQPPDPAHLKLGPEANTSPVCLLDHTLDGDTQLPGHLRRGCPLQVDPHKHPALPGREFGQEIFKKANCPGALSLSFRGGGDI